MITQELLEYIKTQTSNGVTQQDIVKALRNVGWQESVIRQAFGGFENAVDSMMPPMPSPAVGVSSANSQAHMQQQSYQGGQNPANQNTVMQPEVKTRIAQLREVKSQSMIQNPHIHTIAKKRSTNKGFSFVRFLVGLLTLLILLAVLLGLFVRFNAPFPGSTTISNLPIISSFANPQENTDQANNTSQQVSATNSQADGAAVFTAQEQRAIDLLPEELQKKWITPENLMAYTFDELQNKHFLSFTTSDPLQYIIEAQDAVLLNDQWTQEFTEDTVFFDRENSDGSFDRVSLRPFEANVSITYQHDTSQVEKSTNITQDSEINDESVMEETSETQETQEAQEVMDTMEMGEQEEAGEVSQAESAPEDTQISEGDTTNTNDADSDFVSNIQVQQL